MFSISFNSAVSGISEHENSRKPDAESFNVLRKLKEIMQSKELQSALLNKLGFYSSEQNLSAVKDLKSSSSGRKAKRIDELKPVHEIPPIRKDVQRKLLTDSKASNSNELVNGKQVMESIENYQLRERLKFLEEESKILRQELVEQLEEREMLMNEIYQHFRVIYYFLQLENPEYAERFSDVSFNEDGGRGTGPAEVLPENQRTNITALKESPEE
ncbi:uncharacterized protein LOC126683180 isoform X1 [Mercurialis annua]|uniref:uncharacterized protein LOC126683180 isoform X1 n=1 Tax=Mercurialis annua TaxID=3986 RepID=UPI00215FB2FB|nr:uncharacterized protein LOC126683180 isoform X1 [Mercurialis annua]